MALTEARKRANEKYNAKAYDQLQIRLKKGQKAVIKAHADKHSESVNGFISRAIEEAIERDSSNKN